MPADPNQVIRILAYRGVTVLLEGDRLAAGPRRRIAPELRHLIASTRPVLRAHLAEEARLAQTVANVLALGTLDRRQWEREVLAASPDDPNRTHDVAALARVRRAAHEAGQQEVA